MKIIYTLIFGGLICFSKITTASCQHVSTNNSMNEQKETLGNNPYSLPTLQPGYYIVAGVFTVYNNATAFHLQLKEKIANPLIVISSIDQKIYVCLGYSPSSSLIKEVAEIRKIKGLQDAWILKVADSKETKVSEKQQSIVKTNSVSQPLNSKGKSGKLDISQTHNNYKLYVNTRNGAGALVPSTISVINGEKATVVSTTASSKLLSFNYPKAERQTIQLSCDAFGFHKTIFDLKLNDPVDETTLRFVKVSGDTIIVDMPLKKYQKADVMVMYNVFFFSASNAIRPKSNYELQQLLELFKENPTLKIKIHGHTNGRSGGKITKVKGDLYSLDDHTIKRGSAKTLSKLRANTIKNYLVLNGISEDRIKIKGWGGKKMIHKEHSPQAEYNVRVEIEVLEE